MAIIYSYPTVVPKVVDKLIITQTYDSSDEAPVEGNPTRSAAISDILALVGQAGTANTLSMFSGAGLVDSLVSQANAIVYIGTQASGTRFTNTSISTPILLGTDLYVANIYGQNGGLLSVQGNAIIGNEATDTLTVNSVSTFNADVLVLGNTTLSELSLQGPISDYSGNLGGADQVLVSNNIGKASWEAITRGTVKGTGTVNFVPKWSATDTLQDSIIFDDGTNVGIGTSGINPEDKLHVQGTVRAVVPTASGAAFNAINSSGGASSGIRFDNNNSGLILKTSAEVVTAKISSSGFSYFTGGQVGFGTKTPSAAVDIVATVENSGMLLSNVGDNSAYDSVRFTYSGFNAGSPEFIFTPKTQPSAGLTNTFFRFKTNGGASIANVANVSIDGKLGVGTTTPLANLDVKETTTNVAGQIIVGGQIASSTDDTPFGKLSFANTASANTQPNKILASIEGRKNGSSNRGILTFGVADGSGGVLEKMRIDAYGRVGIQTDSPDRELDVDGGVRIRHTLDLFQGNDNSFAGQDAGNLYNIVAGSNTGFGKNSQLVNVSGSSNTSMGLSSLGALITGNNNTAIGTNSMSLVNGGSQNVGLGGDTLLSATGGNSNTAIGYAALTSKTTSNFNTAVGNHSLSNITTGFRNTAVGNDAGRFISDGVAANSTGRNSIFIGDSVKANANNEDNQIVIGYNAIGNGANTATIGNVATTALHVGGNNAGIVLKSPDGTAYKIKVANGGTLTVTAV